MTCWGMPKYRGEMISWNRKISSTIRVMQAPARRNGAFASRFAAFRITAWLKMQTANVPDQINPPMVESTPV